MELTNSHAEKEQHLYKVIVIGDYAVGKTSLIKRYCEGYFTPNYKLTIGVDFAVKSIDWDENKNVSLQLWDVAGHERFGTMTSVYYKYAIAAIIVFDLSRPATFDAVAKWQHDVNSKVMLANNQPIPTLLLANKCDMPGVVIDREQLDKYVDENGFIGWFETSAAQDVNIDDAVKFLIAKIIDVAKSNTVDRPTDTINLAIADHETTFEGKTKKKDCCLLHEQKNLDYCFILHLAHVCQNLPKLQYNPQKRSNSTKIQNKFLTLSCCGVNCLVLLGNCLSHLMCVAVLLNSDQ